MCLRKYVLYVFSPPTRNSTWVDRAHRKNVTRAKSARNANATAANRAHRKQLLGQSPRSIQVPQGPIAIDFKLIPAFDSSMSYVSLVSWVSFHLWTTTVRMGQHRLVCKVLESLRSSLPLNQHTTSREQNVGEAPTGRPMGDTYV